MIGSLSVGYVLGNSMAAAFKGTKQNDQLLRYLGSLREKFTDELSRHGMSILAPALTGTILVPVLASKLDEVFGIDLTDLPQQLMDQFEKANSGAKRKSKKNKKRNIAGKHSKRKKAKPAPLLA